MFACGGGGGAGGAGILPRGEIFLFLLTKPLLFTQNQSVF